jgi:hypothetical protein
MKILDILIENAKKEYHKQFEYSFTETDFLRLWETRKYIMDTIESFLETQMRRAWEEGFKMGNKKLKRCYMCLGLKTLKWSNGEVTQCHICRGVGKYIDKSQLTEKNDYQLIKESAEKVNLPEEEAMNLVDKIRSKLPINKKKEKDMDEVIGEYKKGEENK